MSFNGRFLPCRNKLVFANVGHFKLGLAVLTLQMVKQQTLRLNLIFRSDASRRRPGGKNFFRRRESLDE